MEKLQYIEYVLVILPSLCHGSCTSYYNLSSVMDSVCPLTPRPFMDLRAPNLAGRSERGTKNTSRKRNCEIRNGCHGNQDILSCLR